MWRSASPWTSKPQTLHPSAAKPFAIAAPIPFAPPITATVCPSRFSSIDKSVTDRIKQKAENGDVLLASPWVDPEPKGTPGKGRFRHVLSDVVRNSTSYVDYLSIFVIIFM
jgi:hypothetical protein